MAFERYLKRDCGCEHELVHTDDKGYKLYLSVCKTHTADWQFREDVNALGKKFDAGLDKAGLNMLKPGVR